MKILLADDERDLCKALAAVLKHAQYQVESVHDGEDALYYTLHGQYDLLILDVMMPKLSGFQVLAEIRKAGLSIPILMLTARDQTEDIVHGLRAGADDYLCKPFAMEVLLARVEALLRRPKEIADHYLDVHSIQLNRNKLRLEYLGNSVELTNKEFQLLELLLLHKGQSFSVDHIMDRIWGYDTDSDRTVVWTNISSLRRKLEEIGANVQIRNQRNVGYYLEDLA